MRRSLLPLLRCPRSAQPLELHEVVVDPTDGAIVFGTLEAEGFSYPILAGIPILLPGTETLVELVRSGGLREATARAALGDVERSRALPVIGALCELRAVGRLARRVEHLLRERQTAKDAARLFGDPPGDELAVDPLTLLYLDARRPTPEGYNYFHFRFGTPRYLVSLALIDALPPPDGPVVDVGCGAGHLTWALTQRNGAPVVGVDPSFAQLLAAAKLAPDAHLVCGDGRSLPLRAGSFAQVLSSDVLPYVTEKATAARELMRVLAPEGRLVLTALRNAGQEHVHGGEPLSPLAWAGLVEELPYRRVLADDAVLDRYLDGRGPGGLDDAGATSSQTLSIVGAHEPVVLREDVWDVWPHARGRLAPHPLLQAVATHDGSVEYERRFPSDTFARDNQPIAVYLPARCIVPDVALGSTDGGAASDVEVQRLIAKVVLLGLPDAEHPHP